MEEIKVSEMLQADSIEKDNAVMIIQGGVNKKASGSIQTATGNSLSLTSVADTCKVKSNSKNLFNVSTEKVGYMITNGSEQANSAWNISDYIPVSPSTTYTLSSQLLSGQTAGQIEIAEYNANKTYTDVGYFEENISKSITTTSATAYVIIGYRNNRQTNVQFEQGSTATSYNPYNTEVLLTEKNLFYGTPIYFSSSNVSYSKINNGIRVTKNASGNQFVLYKLIDVSNKVGTTYTLRADFGADGRYIIGLCNEDGSDRIAGTIGDAGGTAINYTIPIITNAKYLAIWLYAPLSANGSIDYTNIQVEEGNIATEYSNKQQYLTLTPSEEKPALSYNNKTIVEANGSVTIEYNTQSRLLNNDDVLDIVEPVKEYVDTEIEKATTYSTDEVVVGTWIDGKPLYRKVIQVTYASGSTTSSTNTGISNVDTMCKASFFVNKNNSDFENAGWYWATTDNLRAFYRKGGSTIEIRSATTSNTYYLTAILEYTKTTD